MFKDSMIVKSLQKCFLASSVVLFQGCSLMPTNDKPEILTTNDTVIVETKNEPTQRVRALPRRPVVVDDVVEPETISSDVILYEVVKGDSLWKIACRYHVSLQQLLEVNHFTKDHVFLPGDMIVIPNGKSEEYVENTTSYKVKKGDTLSEIALRFHVRLSELKACNGLKSDKIFVGKTLKIPQKGEVIQEPVKEIKKVQYGDTYTVQAGDSLSLIAVRTGVKVSQLMELNNITNPKALQIGKVLYLNEKNPATESVVEVKAQEEPSVETPVIEAKEIQAPEEKSSEVLEKTEPVSDEEFDDFFEEGQDIPVIPLDEE